MLDYEQTLFDKIVVALIAPDPEAWKSCLSGDSVKACGSAALDLPWARALKGLKVLKASDEAADAGRTVTRCNSFVPGTEVLMADGTSKPIEDVEIGDRVLATDPETGRTSVKTVTAEITGEGRKHLVDIDLVIDGRTVRVTATDGHPFWVPGLADWIDAGNLKPGQDLHTASGKNVRITALSHRTVQALVFNLTVADVHTYYVLAGATPVLVHNSNGCPTGRLSDPLPRGMNNKIASAYDDVRAGRIPSHDTYSGREHPWWAGSKEYRVPGRPETDRFWRRSCLTASRCTVGHPRITRRFNASAHLTSLTRGGISSLIR